ncbi:lytic transglycosylase domain-containing protein [Consotaella aegiceratis]|uniref:lytic transglycosylase domain-containing protein n=1 Tax=Consotaella aegiceratis TaxID=3097961 RepID=UPI002F40E676
MMTRRLRRTALAVLLSISSSGVAHSEPIAAEAATCERAMEKAARSLHVPLAILYAVGLAETGRKGTMSPFALNVAGKPIFPHDKGGAVAAFEAARKKGTKLIDVGCMQINHRYHGEAFGSVSDMLDPERNVRYAAEFLARLRQREGNWTMAVARYHAGPNNDPAQKRYVCRVIENMIAVGAGRWTTESQRFCKG